MTIYDHPDDAPVYEGEIIGNLTTLRGTVDEIDGEPWCVIAAETNDPAGAQLFLDLRKMPGMSQRDVIVAVLNMGEQMLRAYDAIEREQEARAA